MHPVQVWLPRLGMSAGDPAVARDIRRVYDVWNGEAVVYLLPDLKEPVRWKDRDMPFPLLAIPAEHLNIIDVYHVGENGYAFGPGSGIRFPDGKLDGLLDSWLNCIRWRAVQFVAAPREFHLAFPRFNDGQVTYEEETLTLKPGPTLPIISINEGDHTILSKWPPDERHLKPVFPAVESSEYYGPLHRTDDDVLPTAMSAYTPEFRSIHVALKWSDYLRPLFPITGGGIDDLHGVALMNQVAQESAKDLEKALRAARNYAEPYLTATESSTNLAWFWPTYCKEGEAGVLFLAESRFGLVADTISDLAKIESWRAILRRPVHVRRAWGTLGLFWALLLEELEAGRSFQICQRCHQVIGGKKGKRFCSSDDNPQCYRDRRAADKRRERNHKEHHPPTTE